MCQGKLESGKDYTVTCVVDEKGLNDAVGIEQVLTYTNAEGKEYIYEVNPMDGQVQGKQPDARKDHPPGADVPHGSHTVGAR